MEQIFNEMISSEIEIKKTYYDFGKLFKVIKDFIDSYNKKHKSLKNRLNANHWVTVELITRPYAKQLNKAISLKEDINNKLAGFISKEIHRGKVGIEIWANPLIFTLKKLSIVDLNSDAKIPTITSLFTDKVKKIHPLVHEQQELNNNNSNVEKLITPKEQGALHTAHKTKNNFVTRTSNEQDMNTEESRTSDSKNKLDMRKIQATRNRNRLFYWI